MLFILMIYFAIHGIARLIVGFEREKYEHKPYKPGRYRVDKNE